MHESQAFSSVACMSSRGFEPRLRGQTKQKKKHRPRVLQQSCMALGQGLRLREVGGIAAKERGHGTTGRASRPREEAVVKRGLKWRSACYKRLARF